MRCHKLHDQSTYISDAIDFLWNMAYLVCNTQVRDNLEQGLA